MNTYVNFDSKIVFKKLSEITENPKNARIHSKKQIKTLVKSIKKFNFTNPILIDGNGMIIAGHCRYKAAQELKMETVPTISLEHLTPEEVKAYAIMDNRLGLDSEWDFELLKDSFKELIDIGFDVELTGWEIPEIDNITLDFAGMKENKDKNDVDDEIPKDSEIIRQVNYGDLWQLGNHYMYNGNALLKESYEFLLGKNRARLVISDLPYNVPIKGHVCGNGKIQHENFKMASGEMSSDKFIDFLKTAIQYKIDFSVDGSLHYLFMDWRHVLELSTAGKLYTEFKNICVWNKLVPALGSHYKSQHELVFVYKNGKQPCINNIQLGKFGRNRSNVWDFKGVHVTNPENKDELRFHPTCKPCKLISEIILDSSNPNDIILDNFAGAGSTLLGAEKTGRRAYVCEIESKYCDTIIYRYEKLTGKKAVLVDNFGGANHG